MPLVLPHSSDMRLAEIMQQFAQLQDRIEKLETLVAIRGQRPTVSEVAAQYGIADELRQMESMVQDAFGISPSVCVGGREDEHGDPYLVMIVRVGKDADVETCFQVQDQLDQRLIRTLPQVLPHVRLIVSYE